MTRRRDSGEIAAGLRPLATAEVRSREALDANRCDRRATYILTYWLMLKHIKTYLCLANVRSFVTTHKRAAAARPLDTRHEPCRARWGSIVSCCA